MPKSSDRSVMASLYVSKYKSGWRVIEESYTDGERSQSTVPKSAYQNLGINPEWGVEEVRRRVKTINARASEAREESRKIVAISRRVEKLSSIKSAYLPEALVKGFESRLRESSFGSEKHKQKLESHWVFVQSMIAELKLEPSEYFDSKHKIYEYFLSRSLSPDYVSKLMRVLNLWGVYVCKHQSQAYEPVPKPRGQVREKLDEAYVDSTRYIGESDPLTPKMLEGCSLRQDLKNWLSISVWFGLRPQEIDGLKESKTWRVEGVDGVAVLWVYQSKLSKLSRAKRWKGIPAILPEQIECLRIISAQDFNRPLLKSLPYEGVTLYGGRKGFIDLMLENNQRLEDISAWMGHQSIEITWQKYRNKKRVSWTG